MNRTAKLCLAAVLLLAVLATPLTACGNKTPAAQTPSDQATAPSTSATTPSNAPKMSEIDLSDVTDVSQFHETDDVTDYVRMTVRYTMKNGTVRKMTARRTAAARMICSSLKTQVCPGFRSSALRRNSGR